MKILYAMMYWTLVLRGLGHFSCSFQLGHRSSIDVGGGGGGLGVFSATLIYIFCIGT